MNVGGIHPCIGILPLTITTSTSDSLFTCSSCACRAYNLQDLGYDTVMANLLLNHGADERTYEVAQAILEDLGLNQVRLLTNNPDKIEQVEKDSHIKVVERVPMVPKSWEAIEQGRADELEVKEGAVENKIVRGKELDKYLKVKVERMRHLIPIPTAMA